MIISLIAAVDSNFTIGNKGKIPWGHIKENLKYFRKHTVGKPVIVGRKTFESLPAPLHQRFNIVMTRTRDFSINHNECVIVHSPGEALEKARQKNAGEVVIIGGAEIYALFLPLADRLYLTFVLGNFEGDARFPEFTFFGEEKEWEEDMTQQICTIDAETEHWLCFSVFERVRIKNTPIN